MLESIGVIGMKRMNTMRLLMEKWIVDICPNIQKISELSKDQQRLWVIPCGGNNFEVRKGYKAFKVDETNRRCSCRVWQLSGLACSHAITCIFRLNKMVRGYVLACFRKDIHMLAYNQYIKPTLLRIHNHCMVLSCHKPDETHAENIAGTQQSQVFGARVGKTSNEPTMTQGTRTIKAARNEGTGTKEAVKESDKAITTSAKPIIRSKKSLTTSASGGRTMIK
nr:pentatricopeptide repeat-containing protein [Tanacetum cinerariifolium]